MTKIARIPPRPAVLTLGVTFLVLGVLSFLFLVVEAWLGPNLRSVAVTERTRAMAIVIPFGVLVGALSVWLFCVVYNVVAPRVGGIEIELVEAEPRAGA